MTSEVSMDVTITYLEMLDPARLRPGVRTVRGLTYELAQSGAASDFRINRQWYCEVGRDWTWTDRLVWSDAKWQAYVTQAGFETWIATLDGVPAGYFELDHQPDSGPEIASFGLLREFVGSGLGGPMLTAAIKRAWQKQPPRVWLHTCTLDHPHALANYQARGFEIYKTETERHAR